MKIAILGAGKIASKMAQTLNMMNDEKYELYAVGSSSLEKSEDFAKKYNIKKAYGSYEELAKDSEIDLVYISTIHTMHFEHAMLCLENGRNVLVEKPFAVNKKQAQIMFDKAKEKNLFICEAMWTRFMPSGKYLEKIAADKVIGDVSSAQATIGYNIADVERMKNPALAGGTLLDVGIYALHFAIMVFGNDFVSCNGECVYLESGVDAAETMTMKWKNCIASLHATMFSETGNPGSVFGSEGYLKVDNINNPKAITRYDNGNNLVETADFSNQLTGYEYEIIGSCRAIENGEIECAEVPHSLTLQVMETMDKLRYDWGVKYPFED